MKREPPAMNPPQPDELKKDLPPWDAAQFPTWKIQLFDEWFVPRPSSAPDPFVGRALRAPGA